IAGAVFVAAGAVLFALSGDLPLGSMGMPGAGMLPKLTLVLMMVFGLVLVAGAGESPPLAELSWSELPHALRVIAIAAAAIYAYTTLGFIITMALLLFLLTAVVERRPVLPAAAFSLGVTLLAYVLFTNLLKSPLPRGLFGY